MQAMCLVLGQLVKRVKCHTVTNTGICVLRVSTFS